MIQKFLLQIKQFFFPKSFKIQSFTYYIPSPPARESGYREKGFDKVFYSFINQGYEILSIDTQANKGPNHSGMWVICTVRSTNKKAANLNLANYSNDTDLPGDEGFSFAGDDDSIDGLYAIDEKNLP
ncbi:MAG: hypothetical protein DRQ88_11440 [Epsilonproteobacteria bacterium]|nr:MAG: hypothetical protein DRQ88_11440 [Campylobacterota bacterium]RLA64945.1 MAG: hypothetical protein DRQ89_02670 [Campylobacterota bacterium]